MSDTIDALTSSEEILFRYRLSINSGLANNAASSIVSKSILSSVKGVLVLINLYSVPGNKPISVESSVRAFISERC